MKLWGGNSRARPRVTSAVLLQPQWKKIKLYMQVCMKKIKILRVGVGLNAVGLSVPSVNLLHVYTNNPVVSVMHQYSCSPTIINYSQTRGIVPMVQRFAEWVLPVERRTHCMEYWRQMGLGNSSGLPHPSPLHLNCIRGSCWDNFIRSTNGCRNLGYIGKERAQEAWMKGRGNVHIVP